MRWIALSINGLCVLGRPFVSIKAHFRVFYIISVLLYFGSNSMFPSVAYFVSRFDTFFFVHQNTNETDSDSDPERKRKHNGANAPSQTILEIETDTKWSFDIESILSYIKFTAIAKQKKNPLDFSWFSSRWIIHNFFLALSLFQLYIFFSIFCCCCCCFSKEMKITSKIFSLSSRNSVYSVRCFVQR